LTLCSGALCRSQLHRSAYGTGWNPPNPWRTPQTLTGWDHSQPVIAPASVVFSVIEIP